jgi:hypothetical protein
MLGKPTIQIPGKSIRPPDDQKGNKCPSCRRFIIVPRIKRDAYTKKLKVYCPYCGYELGGRI